MPVLLWQSCDGAVAVLLASLDAAFIAPHRQTSAVPCTFCLPVLQLREPIVISHQRLIGRQTDADTRDQSIYLHFYAGGSFSPSLPQHAIAKNQQLCLCLLDNFTGAINY